MRRHRGPAPGPVLALVLALGALTADPGAAQRHETLLSGELESGGFGGPMIQVMPTDDELALFVGGRGGWIINHAFSIGGGGWALVNDVPTSVTDTADTRLHLSYGGVILEYTFRPFDLLHYSVSVLSGWGAAGYSRDVRHDPPTHAFFVMEPAAHVEVNITEFLRLAAGASYRYSSGLDLEGFTDDNLQRTAGVLTVKFGAF